MSQMIEFLESRTLLSASATVIAGDVAAVKAAGTSAKSDLASAVAAAGSDVKAVKAAVAAAHPTPAQKKQLAALQKSESSAAAKERQKLGTILAAGFRHGARVVAVPSAEGTPGRRHRGGQGPVGGGGAGRRLLRTGRLGRRGRRDRSRRGSRGGPERRRRRGAGLQAAVTAAEGHLGADLTTLSSDATALQAAIARLSADLG